MLFRCRLRLHPRAPFSPSIGVPCRRGLQAAAVPAPTQLWGTLTAAARLRLPCPTAGYVGPGTVKSRELESMRPSAVQTAPWASQSVVLGSWTLTSESP